MATFSRCPHGAEGAKELPRVSFLRALISFTSASPSCPRHHPKVPPPNTITLEGRISTYELGEPQTFCLQHMLLHGQHTVVLWDIIFSVATPLTHCQPPSRKIAGPVHLLMMSSPFTHASLSYRLLSMMATASWLVPDARLQK